MTANPSLAANGLNEHERAGLQNFLTTHEHCLMMIETAFKEVGEAQQEKMRTGVFPRTMLERENFYKAAVDMRFSQFAALVRVLADLRDGKQITETGFHVLMTGESSLDALKEWATLLQDISEQHATQPSFGKNGELVVNENAHIPSAVAMFDKVRLEDITKAVDSVIKPLVTGLRNTELLDRMRKHLVPLTPEQLAAIENAPPVKGVVTDDPNPAHLHGLNKLPGHPQTQVERLEQQKAAAMAAAGGIKK